MDSAGSNKISIKIWPEIILAVNRTDKVRGRIIILIISIKIKKGAKILGLPKGVKWVIIMLGNLNHPKRKKIKKKVKEKYKFIFNCLVIVNTYGSIPKILNCKINVKKVIKTKFPPNKFLPINKENSFFKKKNIFKIKNIFRELKYQYLKGKKKTKKSIKILKKIFNQYK